MTSSGIAMLLVLAHAANGLTPQQVRGRVIYMTGESVDRRAITALVGARDDAVPATVLPCASCHGDDGRGRPEGGLRPADITPAALARAATGARSRPAYTWPLLVRAITTGVDSARNALDRAMPHYRLDRRDAGDLVAYLGALGSDATPGVGDDVIRIGVIGAPDLVAPPTTIYGRRIELRDGRDDDVLLVIDASPDGRRSIDAAARTRVPTLVVQSTGAVPNRYAFQLTASDDDQVAALHGHARHRRATPLLRVDGCRDIAHAPADALVLMTSTAAAACNLATIPVALDRRVIVAAASPPGSSIRDASARDALSIAVGVLATLGRDPSRAALLDALEHVDGVETSTFPPLTWRPGRHVGTNAAWLMTLDVPTQRLVGEPGWISGD